MPVRTAKTRSAQGTETTQATVRRILSRNWTKIAERTNHAHGADLAHFLRFIARQYCGAPEGRSPSSENAERKFTPLKAGMSRSQRHPDGSRLQRRSGRGRHAAIRSPCKEALNAKSRPLRDGCGWFGLFGVVGCGDRKPPRVDYPLLRLGPIKVFAAIRSDLHRKIVAQGMSGSLSDAWNRKSSKIDGAHYSIQI